MLHLSTKRLKIYLSPAKLILVLQQGLIVRRALTKHVIEIDNKQLTTDEVLTQLKAVLLKSNYQNMGTDVLLSADYVRFLVNQADYRLTYEEQYVLVRHSFEAVYGEDVNDWSIFLSNTGFNKNEFACGVESIFIKEITSLMQQQNLKLISIAPLLTLAINYFRKRISLNAWFVLIEQDNMQLVKFLNGSPVLLRSVNLYSGWENEIEAIFARESLYLQDNRLPVYWFWPEKPDFINELLKKSKVNILRMKTIEGFSHSRDSAWAIGLCA